MTPPVTFARPCAGVPTAFAGLIASVLLTPFVVGLGGSPIMDRAWGSGPGVTNHPIRVVPSAAVSVPSGWPLDDNGALTCFTCHTEVSPGGGVFDPKLRDFESQDVPSAGFCARCHGQIEQRSAGSVHWLALGTAHLKDDRVAPRAGGGVLDSRTRQCLSCHDGVSALESTNGTPVNGTRAYMSDRRRNHPIGVQYGGVSRPKDLSPLRPAGLLPREVALPDGKVGCVSCHNLYARTEYLLTVPIRGSELCLTCHDMR